MMKNETEQAIEKYVGIYSTILESAQDGVVIAAIMENVGKDSRMNQMRAWGVNGKSNGNGADGKSIGSISSAAPTQNQLDYLHDLKVAIPAGLTRKLASELIDAAKPKKAA